MKKLTKRIMAFMLSLVMMLGCIPSFINEASASASHTLTINGVTAGAKIGDMEVLLDSTDISEKITVKLNSFPLSSEDTFEDGKTYVFELLTGKVSGIGSDGDSISFIAGEGSFIDGPDSFTENQSGSNRYKFFMGYVSFSINIKVKETYHIAMDNVVADGNHSDLKLYLDGQEIDVDSIDDDEDGQMTETTFLPNKTYIAKYHFNKDTYKPVAIETGENAYITYDASYPGEAGTDWPSGHGFVYDDLGEPEGVNYYGTIAFKVNYRVRNTAPEADKETNHGYITISKTSVTSTDQLEVTAYPDEGYKVGNFSCNYDNDLGMTFGKQFAKNNLTYTLDSGINGNVKIGVTFREIVSAVDINYTPVNAKTLTTQAPNAISLVEPSHLISEFNCFELVRLYDREGNLLYIYNPVSGEPGNFVYSWFDMNTEEPVDEPVWDNVECAIDFVNLSRQSYSRDDFASDTTVTYDNGQQSLTQISEGDVAEGYYFEDDYYESVCIQMLLPIEAPVPTGGGSSRKYKATDTKDTTEKITGTGKKGSTRTIVPEEGRKVASVKVVDKNGNEVPVTMNEDGTYSFEQPASNVDVLVSYKNREITLNIGSTEASVDGERENLDVCPVIRNDRTMLPIRFVAENLGAKVEWNEKNPNYVAITRGDTKIEITLGSDIMKVNGKDFKLDSVAFAENDRTYLPVRAISEALNAIVEWNENEPSVVRIYERQ